MLRISAAFKFLKSHLFDDNATLFPLALILTALGEVTVADASQLKDQIAIRLLKEKNQQGSFNYWLKGSEKFLTEAYPDDLDDTCCAWSALFAYDQNLLNKETLLALVNLLVFSQLQPGGPYYTWLVKAKDRQKWSEVDLVVNINIARFLASQKVRVLGLEKYIESKIAADTLSSVFYDGELASLYFLSHFYRGKLLWKLKDKIKIKLNLQLTQEELLLLAIAVLRFGFTDLLEKLDINKLINLQQTDGGVKAIAFYNYFNSKTKSRHYSSRALSTAFYIELLNLWQTHKNQEYQLRLKFSLEKNFRTEISKLKRASNREALTKKAAAIIYSQHADLALFLPQLLSADLLYAVKINQQLLDNLSLINLCAWVAYTIYDDLNDGDGDLRELPLANISLHLLYELGQRLPRAEFYLPKLGQLLTTMEENFLLEKKFSSVQKLTEEQIFISSYNKSIGLTFSIYFLLDYYGLSEQTAILELMRCIILLKQINDDLHDCFGDLKKGRINIVNYYLLKLNLKSYDDKFAKIIFYQKIIPQIHKKMIFYLQRAKQLLKKQKLLKQDNYFKKILSYYEKLLNEGQRDRENLLSYYQGSS